MTKLFDPDGPGLDLIDLEGLGLKLIGLEGPELSGLEGPDLDLVYWTELEDLTEIIDGELLESVRLTHLLGLSAFVHRLHWHQSLRTF